MGDGRFLSMLLTRAPSRLAWWLRAGAVAFFFGGLALINVELSRVLAPGPESRLSAWPVLGLFACVILGWVCMLWFGVEVDRRESRRGRDQAADAQQSDRPPAGGK